MYQLIIYTQSISKHIKQHLLQTREISDYILVSPDAGGVKGMYHMAKLLQFETIIMHKERSYTQKNKVTNTVLIGDSNRIKDKICIIIDDICDTAGTISQASETLMNYGATEIIILVTHGILSGPAIKKLFYNPSIKELITTNSFPLNDQLHELAHLRHER